MTVAFANGPRGCAPSEHGSPLTLDARRHVRAIRGPWLVVTIHELARAAGANAAGCLQRFADSSSTSRGNCRRCRSAAGAVDWRNSHTMRLLAIIGLLVLSSLGCETEDETSTFVPTTPSIVTTTPTGPRCDANLIEVGDWWHERHMGLGDNASVEFNIYFRFTRRPPEGCQYYVFVSYVVKQRGRVVAAGAPVGESTQMHDADYPGRWYCPMQSCHSGHLAEPRGAYEIAWNWLACEIGYCTRTELQPPD